MSKDDILIPLSTYFNIEEEDLMQLGVFNFNLTKDTPLFIDPLKLKKSNHTEMKLADQNFLNHFKKVLPQIIEYIRGTKELEEDIIKSFIFHESYQIPLGYSITKNKGSGMSDGHAIEILKNIKDYFNEPSILSEELFRYIPMFGGEYPYAIGVDKISDMTISIIIEDLVDFNLKIIKKLKEKYPSLPLKETKIKNKYVNLLKSEYSDDEYVLLVPKDILIHDSQAGSIKNFQWDSAIEKLSDSSILKDKLHTYIDANNFNTQEKNAKKREFIKKLLKDKSNKKEILLEFWNSVKNIEKIDNSYDFENDEHGYNVSLNSIVNTFLDNTLGFDIEFTTSDSLSLSILKIFKQSIQENNFLQDILICNKKDNFFLELLFAYLKSFCEKYSLNFNTTLNREDKYIIVHNDLEKSLIKIKASSNNKVVDNYRKNKSFEKHFNDEKATSGYYIIIGVDNNIDDKLEKLREIKNSRNNKNLDYFIIEANPKEQ